jgi:hypothetical protein
MTNIIIRIRVVFIIFYIFIIFKIIIKFKIIIINFKNPTPKRRIRIVGRI